MHILSRLVFDHAFRAITAQQDTDEPSHETLNCQTKLMLVQVNTKDVQRSQISGCYYMPLYMYMFI